MLIPREEGRTGAVCGVVLRQNPGPGGGVKSWSADPTRAGPSRQPLCKHEAAPSFHSGWLKH